MNNYQNPNLKGPAGTLSHCTSVSENLPLVQKLLPNRPGEKADQRVLLQRVVQEVLKVVHLGGDFQVQLTLKVRANSKNHEKQSPLLSVLQSEHARWPHSDSAPHLTSQLL